MSATSCQVSARVGTVLIHLVVSSVSVHQATISMKRFAFVKVSAWLFFYIKY